MPTTIAELTPGSAEYLASSAIPQFLFVNQRPALAFDAASDEECAWTTKCPQGFSGTMQAVVQYIMASAVSGTVDFEGRLEAVSPGDALDLDATSGFDTPNTMTPDTVESVAGYMGEFTITLTNQDGVQPGDRIRFALKRDADDATNDTATGDAYILGVELRF